MEDVYRVEKIPNENRYGIYVTHPDYADNWGSTTMLVAMRSTKEEADEYAKNREYDKMAKGGKFLVLIEDLAGGWEKEIYATNEEEAKEIGKELFKRRHPNYPLDDDDIQIYAEGEYGEEAAKKIAKGGMTKYYGGGKYDRGTRPSPRESATLFMPGYRRIGQDGNMYVIVENVNGVKRWQRERRYAEGGIVEMGKIITTKENNIVIEAKLNGEIVPLNFKEEELIDESEDGEYMYSYVSEHNGKWYMVEANFTGNPHTILEFESVLGDIEEIENPQIAKDKKKREREESYAKQKAEWDRKDAERIAKEKREGTYDNYVISETIDRYADQSGEWHDIPSMELIVPYTWKRHNSREVYDSMIINEFNKLGYNATDYRPHWGGDARLSKGEDIQYEVGYTFWMAGEGFPEHESEWFDDLKEAIEFAKKKGGDLFYKKYFDGKLAEKGKIELATSKYIPKHALGGEISSPFSIGDIVHGKGHHGEVFYTIITEREIGGGHYAFKSDAVGNPITGSYANTQFIHSFSFKDWQKVGHKELDKVTKHGLTYYKSGDEGTDVYLALLDGVRNKYFWENAPQNLKTKFRGLENDNWHYKSAELVDDFFNHPTWKHLKNHKLVAEEGAYLEEGGLMPANYQDMSAEEVWRKWSGMQRLHFLNDHASDIAKLLMSGEADKINYRNSYNELPEGVQLRIREHIHTGRYAKGGTPDKAPYQIKYRENEDDEKLTYYDDYSDKDRAIDRAQKFQASQGWFSVEVVDANGKVFYENDFGDYRHGGIISGTFWNKHINITW